MDIPFYKLYFLLLYGFGLNILIFTYSNTVFVVFCSLMNLMIKCFRLGFHLHITERKYLSLMSIATKN